MNFKALQTIHRLAILHNLRIATAESLTAGMVSSALATLSGASAYFVGGVAAYDIDAKVNLLGVDRETARDCNCVSCETVEQMAIGAQALFQADYAIATTGYAEAAPDQGVDSPLAYCALVIKEDVAAHIWRVNGFAGTMNRQEFRELVTADVIEVLAYQLGRR